jgi:phosphatidylinositol alpha-1,6-mannosyltransferase
VSPRSLALLALDYPPSTGGIQTLTSEIYSRLADLTRLTVAPAAPAAPAALPNDTLLRTRHPSAQGWRTLLYLRDAAALLAPHRQPPLLLHCNHLFAAYAAYWLRRRYRLPYLVWVHGEELSRSRHPTADRLVLRAADAILVNSDFTANLVGRLLQPSTAPPIYKIPLGAPTAWLAAPPPPSRPATDPRVILTVARLCRRDRYKGVDVALRAMAALRQRGLDFRYRIAGDGDDRGYHEDLARQLNLDDQVEILGRVADGEMMSLYDGCDVFLLASREQESPRGLGFEGFGIVFLEAGARAKPVVGGRSGGIPDAVADGVSGLLADPQSPDAVAAALERLLRDSALRTRLGAQARARVRAGFHWDEAAAQVRALHQELLP